jgi:hypothetical protein
MPSLHLALAPVGSVDARLLFVCAIAGPDGALLRTGGALGRGAGGAGAAARGAGGGVAAVPGLSTPPCPRHAPRPDFGHELPSLHVTGPPAVAC